MARRYGIMYMIFNHKIWGSYNAAAGWRDYTGPNPHTDHIHVSFGWPGALEQTSYWTGRPWSPSATPVNTVPKVTILPTTLSGPTTATLNSGITAAVTGRSGQPVQLWVQRGLNQAWQLAQTGVLPASGRLSYTFPADDDLSYYAVVGATRTSTVSTRLAPTVSGPPATWSGSTVTLSGTSLPGAPVEVYLQRFSTTTYALSSTVT